jgi:hypothetical protein
VIPFQELLNACAVPSTSIGVNPTSQITEYYGILCWITVTMDYSGLRWITV